MFAPLIGGAIKINYRRQLMFKKIIIAAGVIASGVAFSSGALAATAGLTQSIVSGTKDSFATELFGSGSDAVTLTSGAQVKLFRTSSGVSQITPGEIADFTFTLANATFGEAVALGDFVFTDTSTAGAVTITKQSGGAVGDANVVFRVEITSGSIDAGDYLTFTIDKIKGASAMSVGSAKVTATTTIAGVQTTGIDTFPELITNAGTANLIASSTNTVTLTLADGTDATINVAARSDITTGAVAIDHDANAATTARDGVLLVNKTLTDLSAILGGSGVEDDGGTFDFTDTTGDGGGDITIKVTGTFNDGDLVCIDLDGGLDCDAAGEKFTIASGVATWTTTNALFNGDADRNVYYVANGTSTLKPTDFIIKMTVAYDASTMTAETAVTQTVSTSYSGLTADGWSSAIPGSTSSDIANIRVTNHTSAAVTLFAQCYGQDGADLGFHELSAVAAYATTVLSATDLQAVFGTWEGRATCDFSRSGDITVQTMVRSGGILNNLSTTTGKEATNKTRK